MDWEQILPLLMFVTLFVFLLSGFPVAFVLAGTGLLYAVIGYSCDIFLLSDLGFIPPKIYGAVQNFTLLAVPLFVFMGITLEKTGIAEELLRTMEKLFSSFRGGLSISLIFVGMLLAASTGIVGATVVTMGLLSLPTLLEKKYDTRLACGSIAASGTLGQIIPPSIVLIILADMMNVPVADLFAGALLPGLLLVILYSLYVFMASPKTKKRGTGEAPLRPKEVYSALVPPILLIVLVLGSILAGIASPTESAACGAVAAMLLAFFRRCLNWSNLKEICERSTHITTMVFTLLLGAQVFSVVFRGLYGDELIADWIGELEAHPTFILFGVMCLFFLLGFFLDFIEICFIIVPIISPILVGELGVNALWLAVLIAVNLQTSFLTPPFGFALFYLKGVSPPGVTTADIYRGAIPFVILQLIALAIIWIFPEMVTWIPSLLFD